MDKLDQSEREALETDMTVDITTTGRKSGEPRRLEIWAHYIDGRVVITGTPGPRGWYANILADPRLTIHLKGDVQADLAGTARAVTDAAERRVILTNVKRLSRMPQRRNMNVDERVRGSCLIEVTLAE